MSESAFDTCGACRSGKHDRCYEPCLCRDRGHPVETLTPSEVALAKVLAAWEVFPDVKWSPKEPLRTLGDISTALGAGGYIFDGRMTEAGRALLDRARKAGVL